MSDLAFLNEVIDLIVNKKQSIFITGPAGVGKTYLLKQIYSTLKQKNEKIVLTSTTGINALNLGGITIHKLMGMQTRTDLNYIRFMKSSFLFKGISQRMSKVDYIIIDEVSMLRADQLELINAILIEATKVNLPFGGKTMIFTGDFYQIPPVVKSWEKQQNQWLFTSKCWLNANIKTIHLTHVYRQQDKNFVSFLNDIRIGKYNENTISILEECKKRTLPRDTTIFFSTNDECDEYNKQKLNELVGKEYIFLAEIKGKRNKKYAFDKLSIVRDCIAKETLILKPGTRVISVCNDKKNRYMNGSIGYVVSCDDNKGNQHVMVKFEHNKQIVKVIRFNWIKVNLQGKRVANMKQIPLIPAYALTIHKSQGMTLDAAIIDCKNIFACGQLYVALSRVRSLNNLKVINFDKKQIIVSSDVKKYYEKILSLNL